MKVQLLFEDEERRPCSTDHEEALLQDLNLEPLLQAMSRNNFFLYNTAKSVVLAGLNDSRTILYRQEILKDCMKDPAVIQKIYNTAAKAVGDALRYREYNQPNYARVVPVSVRVLKSVGLLEILVQRLEELKVLLQCREKSFQSKGLTSFCERIHQVLPEAFFKQVKKNISDLNYLCEGGRLMLGARIGNGLKGTGYVLRELHSTEVESLKHRKPSKGLQWNEIALDNYSLAASAREIEDAGLIQILRLMNHFTAIMLRFFESLQYEAGFYFGCINLYITLCELNIPVAFAHPQEPGEKVLSFRGLYDLSLALNDRIKPVDNSLDAIEKSLIVITGANQGGKSTFLRSIGLAQLMMQCGLFVAADSFQSGLCDKILTHFIREEDIRMNSGKLDEELVRMEWIVDHITPHSLLLMNESFSSTTERDGSKIAEDIIKAFADAGVRVIFVTHLYEFAWSVYQKKWEYAMFLRAGRNEDASRSFIIREGEPLRTSFGEDLFNSIIMGETCV